MGGAPALAQATEAVRELEYTVRRVAHGLSGGSGAQPKPLPLPESAAERRGAQAVQNAKAQAWKARQRRRAAKN